MEATMKRYLTLIITAFVIFGMSCGGGKGTSEDIVDPPIYDEVPIVQLGNRARLFTADKEDAIDALKASADVRIEQSNKCRYHYYETAVFSPSPDSQAVASTTGGSQEKPEIQFTDTNIQEQGVDEPDIIKTDGEYAFVLSRNNLKIFNIWPFTELNLISQVEIEGTPASLFLREDMVIAFSNIERMEGRYRQDLKVTIINVSDIEHPEVMRETYYEGSFITARRINGSLHIIMNSRLALDESYNNYLTDVKLPDCKDVYGNKDYQQSTELKEAIDELKEAHHERIEQKSIKDILPKMYHKDGNAEYSFDLTLLRSEYISDESLILIASINLDDIESPDFLTAVQGAGSLVYASQGSIYVSKNVNSYALDYNSENITDLSVIHRFNIESLSMGPEYTGSGVVAGHLLNQRRQKNAQFALSEHEGYLRVATTIGWLSRFGSKSVSQVYTLDINDSNLQTVGAVGDLGQGETIYAVRFMGPKGYVVTFKKVDPLYTLDLENPKDPRVVGELKIPGFSNYLHPYDENNIMGLGKDTEDMGTFAWFQGIKLSMFNVSNFAEPKETHNKVIGGRGSNSSAAFDHHAFTFDSRRDLLAIPVTVYEEGGGGNNHGAFDYSGLQIFRVSPESGFDLVGEIKIDAGRNHRWSDIVKRSIIMSDGANDVIVILTDDNISIYGLDDMSELKKIDW